MKIRFSEKYVVDACVLLAYLDPEEPFHSEALEFFKTLNNFSVEGKTVDIIIPAHFYLEVNLNVEKKKDQAKNGKRKAYEPRVIQEKFNWSGQPIDLKLMKKIEDGGLYERFGVKLRPGDFIYAAMAHLESIPLVTLDRGFSKVSSDIEVILLN